MVFYRILAGIVVVLSVLQLGALQAGGHLSRDEQFLFVVNTACWALSAIVVSLIRRK